MDGVKPQCPFCFEYDDQILVGGHAFLGHERKHYRCDCCGHDYEVFASRPFVPFDPEITAQAARLAFRWTGRPSYGLTIGPRGGLAEDTDAGGHPIVVNDP